MSISRWVRKKEADIWRGRGILDPTHTALLADNSPHLLMAWQEEQQEEEERGGREDEVEGEGREEEVEGKDREECGG